MSLTDLALSRAGFSTLAGFQRANGLYPSGRADRLTQRALLPYLTGCLRYRVTEGDTYFDLARAYGTSVRSIITANPDQDPERLRVGQFLTLPLGFPVVATDVPCTYELLLLTLEGLTARYPFLRQSSLALTAYERQIPALRVGIGQTQVLYNAAHHANEWITTPLLLKFLEQYAETVSQNGEIFGMPAQALYQRTTLHLVPMVDPDGVDLVTGGIPADSAEYRAAQEIAAGYPSIPFPDGWKANLSGVDLNLNYPAGWEQAKELKFAQGYTGPAPRDYVGGSPLDQPESAAMAALTERVSPALTVSWHTQGETIYWKYQDLEPPRAQEIAAQFAAVSGYEVADVPYASGFAGYKDWFVLTYGRPGYTVEAGRGENPLPLSQFDELYARNLGILTLGLSLA